MLRFGRAAAILGTAMLVMTGCEWRASQSPSEGASLDDGADERESESAADEPSESDRDEPDKESWKQKVRDKLNDESDLPRDESSDATTPAGCTLMPDSCGEGKSCLVRPSGRRICAEFNPEKSIGDSCGPEDRCDAGQQCIGGESGTCLEVCEPESRGILGCSSDRVCVPVVGSGDDELEWGVCRPIDDRCRPWPDDDCTIGEACVQMPAGRRCRPYREAANVGDPCASARDCRIGQVCIVGGDGVGACRTRCDRTHPCAERNCQPLADRDFGFCPGDDTREVSEPSDSPTITGY